MRLFWVFACYFCMLLGTAKADMKVLASIKPLHALVAMVMEGTGAPGLLLDGNNSPHTYSLTPANANLLDQANVIFWFGPALEAFLEKPLSTLGQKAIVVTFLENREMKFLPVRENDAFDADVHASDHPADHIDPHVWLDPDNAKIMLRVIAETLALKDPGNAEIYRSNANAAASTLDSLSTELAATLKPAHNRGFIVFHDAYQYFERRFDVRAVGAIAIHPENPPGVAAIRNLQNRIAAGQVQCVFSEPQFDDKLVNTILEGSTAHKSTLDPLGTRLDASAKLYPALLRGLANDMLACLKP